MEREIAFIIISSGLGTCALFLHILRLVLKNRVKTVLRFTNLVLHILLFVSLFLSGATLDIILLVFMALATVYFLIEYILYKRGCGV